MLRAGVFVDLYAVVRHGIRASVEATRSRSSKPLYAFVRALPLTDAGKTLAKVQSCLELDDIDGIGAQERTAVEGYNRDDCLSAWKLRDWLENVRAGLIQAGAVIDRPPPKSGEAGEDLTDWQQKIAALVNRLTHDVPVDKEQRSPEQHARWLLAYILDWHRREAEGGLVGALPSM